MSSTEDGNCIAQTCHEIVYPVINNDLCDSSSVIITDPCSLKDYQKEESSIKIYCNACRSEKGKPLAVGRCLSCALLLCRACVFAHKFMICFQGHDVIPLSDSRRESIICNSLNLLEYKTGDDGVNTNTSSNNSSSVSISEELSNSTGSSSLSQNLLEPNRIPDETSSINGFISKHCCISNKMNSCPTTITNAINNNESERHSPLCNLISNLSLPADNSRISTSTFQNQIQQHLHSVQNNILPRQPTTSFNKRDSLNNCQSLDCLNNSVHMQDQTDNLVNKNTTRCSTDLLMFMEKASSALQIQYWKAALKINETISFFKDELAQRKHTLMKTLDDAYDKEHRKLVQLAKEIRNNVASIDISTRVEIMKCCDQMLNNGSTIFDFVAEHQQIKRLIKESSGQLKIKHIFDNEHEKVSQWNTDNIDNTLSSGYDSMSLSQNSNRTSSYLYPPTSHCSDVQYYKQNASYVIDNSQDQIGLTSGSRTDVASPWSITDNSCYWLQDPCWNSDSYSLFPSTNVYQSDVKKVRQLSDLIEPALPCLSKTTTSIENDEPALSLSPGGLQGRYTDLATCSVQSPDPSLSVGSCCCGNRPISSIRRQKMVYHCKFGEFGGLDGQFTEPSGIAVNLESDIIVADTNNHRIQVFDRDGRYKFRFGECGKRDGQLLYPNRVAVFKLSGDIVVTERSPTHQVQIFNQNGTFVRKFGSTVLQHPRGVCVDPSGNIIVAECKVMRVFVFDRFGNAISRFNCSKHLEFPNSVCANDKQEIFISDNRAHCVKVFSYDGRLIRIIGGEGVTNFPIGVGLDNSSNIIVADNHNNFNLTLFSQSGQLLAALESKVKHAQCFDAAIMDSSGSVVLSSKDYHIYIYRYMPLAYLPPDSC